MADYNIKPGVYTHVDSDDWSEIFEKILGADMILFATPVWWGVQSSPIQRVIERLDELNEDLLFTREDVIV